MLLSLLAATSVSATDFPSAPQIFQAKQYTVWDKRRIHNSRVGEVNVQFQNSEHNNEDDYVRVTRLDLVGDAKTRGFDHGYLLANEIIKFVDVDLNKYYMDMVLNLNFDTSGFPQPLQDIFALLKVKGAKAAPGNY